MKHVFLTILATLVTGTCVLFAQGLKEKNVPAAVKDAFAKKYPGAIKVSWEKEDGNYEANWGGKTGEDNAAQFSPSGNFVEYAQAVETGRLPVEIKNYVKAHYSGVAIKEAAKVTDAAGVITFEADIKGKELIFDAKGLFVKEKKE